MFARIKAFFAWVYEWITVLAGFLVGLPAVVLEFLDLLGGTDLMPILPPEKALKIVTCVALLKAACAFIQRRINPA